MKRYEKNTGPAVLVAVVGGFISYWIVSSLIKMTCSSPFFFEHSARLSTAGTSALASFAVATTTFVFAYAAIDRRATEKFDKIVVLALLAYVVLWLLYVFLDGRVCAPEAWRRYIAYLIVPSLLATITLVGKEWLKPDE